MSANYKALRVSKTTARELATDVLQTLEVEVGSKIFGRLPAKTEKKVVDRLTRSVYNRLRRQATADRSLI